MSNRDLTCHIDVSGRDETSELLGALKQMNTNLLGIIGKVQEGAGSIATASNQIAAGNADLSSRTEKQASSLAETAATMEQLTTTVRQNADNPCKANQLAGSAVQVADGSGQVVSRVVDIMQDITSTSEEQSIGIDPVNQTVGQLDQVIQQNAVLVEEAAVASQSMREQADALAGLADTFRLSSAGAVPALGHSRQVLLAA